ncbi:MAG: DUF1778 domain-containing protein [Pseudolabrys sp.]|jgi:uncharacterized protein (DUF1778 family)
MSPNPEHRADWLERLHEREPFVLEPDQYEALVRFLDNPPPAGPKLKALMRRRPLWKD